jgi:hypothetical protein
MRCSDIGSPSACQALGEGSMSLTPLHAFSRVTVNYRPVGEHRRPSEKIFMDERRSERVATSCNLVGP